MYPRTFIWIFTGKCSLKCPHCYASLYRGREELSLMEKIRLVREMAEIGVEYVGISGGEPFLNPDLPIVLKELREHGIGVSIVTNGTVSNDQLLEQLAGNEVYIYISLDGPREIHDRIRGLGVFDKVIETIEKMRRYGLGYATVMAVNRINYRYSREYVELAIEVGAEHAAMIPTMPFGNARNNNLWVNAEEYGVAINNAVETAKQYSYPLAFWCTPFLPHITSYEKAYNHYCRTTSVVDLSVDGSLLLCDVLDLSITSTRNRRLVEALQEYYRDKHVVEVVYPQKLPRECMKCRLKSICKGGCFARSKALYGGYNEGDPLCPIISKNKQKRLYHIPT